MKKNINAALYMESKIVWKRGENIVETDPDGYLYAEGKRRTKILPEDLPEWFVYGYMYKRHGYVSAKGVKHLLYVPNYSVQNHLHKYDSLFISYNDPIEPTEEDNGFKWYKGYDHVLSGSLIVAYVRAAAKYSKYDVKAIFEEINRKQEFFYDRNPGCMAEQFAERTTRPDERGGHIKATYQRNSGADYRIAAGIISSAAMAVKSLSLMTASASPLIIAMTKSAMHVSKYTSNLPIGT